MNVVALKEAQILVMSQGAEGFLFETKLFRNPCSVLLLIPYSLTERLEATTITACLPHNRRLFQASSNRSLTIATNPKL